MGGWGESRKQIEPGLGGKGLKKRRNLPLVEGLGGMGIFCML